MGGGRAGWDEDHRLFRLRSAGGGSAARAVEQSRKAYGREQSAARTACQAGAGASGGEGSRRTAPRARQGVVTGQITIGRFNARYLVSREHPDPSRVAARLDDAAALLRNRLGACLGPLDANSAEEI